MFACQVVYFELYQALNAYAGDDVYGDVLQPWLIGHADERSWLVGFGARAGTPWPDASVEDLGRLYAVSRVNDVLLVGLTAPASRAGPTVAQYLAFMSGLGFRAVNQAQFNPFFHEIVVAAGVDDAAQPIVVMSEQWPCLMLGELLFSRAGCEVVGGVDHLNPSVATQSVLHWAHRRRARAVTDLSVGWGSMSQWRTSFRRDYWRGDSFHFNVDGSIDAREQLMSHERVELLVNRCFVRSARFEVDLWPWDDRLSLDLAAR